jgi:hypothetical protein
MQKSILLFLIFLWVYKILRELALDTREATVEYKLFSSYSGGGCVSIKGKHIVIYNKELLLDAVKASNNFDVFSKIDGTVKMDFTFHNLIKKPNLTNKDEKIISKFLDVMELDECLLEDDIELEESPRNRFIKSFDVVSMAVEEATNKFSNLWKLNGDKYKSLKHYCNMIDNLVDEFESKSLVAKVNENDMTIEVKMECIDLDIYEHNHQYYELIQKTKSIGFSAKDETNMWVEFVFSGVWDKQNNDN